MLPCRYYVTPKSYLDLLLLYIALLRDKRQDMALARDRLLNGLAKLQASKDSRAPDWPLSSVPVCQYQPDVTEHKDRKKQQFALPCSQTSPVWWDTLGHGRD